MQSTTTFSVEFFPPKDLAGEERLWAALEALVPLEPDFVSVTYGAGGSTRDRTIKITREITKRTGLKTIAHITCVGSTEKELRNTLQSYLDAGIKTVLALRGDPPGGPSSSWVSTPGGFDHADQLVSLSKQMGFEVGVAAFPDTHPASKSIEKDIDVLLEKERRGAGFATTQFFFDVKKYRDLSRQLKERGSSLPVIAGVLPITNVRQLERMAELSGTPIPSNINERIQLVKGDNERVKRVGIEIAIEISQELLMAEVPGIHFYTMNSAESTIDIVKRIGLR